MINENGTHNIDDSSSNSNLPGNQGMIVKNSIWNSIGVLVYFACQWLLTIFVVWLYDDHANVGNLALAMSVTNVFTAVALYNVRVFQVSDIKNEYSDGDYVIARVFTCFAAILLCAVFVFVVDFSPMQRLIIIIYMIFRANESFVDVLHGIDQKKWKMDYIGISLAARGILMLAAFVILGWQFDLLEAIIGMAVITTLVGLLYDIPKTKKLAQLTTRTGEQIISLLKRCFPLMILAVVNILIVSYARILLERIHGEEALGVYAAVTVPAMAIQIATTILFVPILNLISDSLKEKNKMRFVKLFMLTFCTVIGITFAFAVASHFIGEWGLGILYDSTIVPYAYLLPGGAVVVGLISFLVFMNLIFTAVRDIKGLFIGITIGMVVCIATADFFINRFGIIGANHVMIVSQSAAAIFLMVRLFWYLKKKRELFE